MNYQFILFILFVTTLQLNNSLSAEVLATKPQIINIENEKSKNENQIKSKTPFTISELLENLFSVEDKIIQLEDGSEEIVGLIESAQEYAKNIIILSGEKLSKEIPFELDNKRKKLLTSRMKANQQKGYIKAYDRDKLELINIETRHNIRELIFFIHHAKIERKSKSNITEHLKNKIKWVKTQINTINAIKTKHQGSLSDTMISNQTTANKAMNVYSLLIDTAETHITVFWSGTFSEYIELGGLIEKVNNHKVGMATNLFLKFFGLDSGRVVLFLITLLFFVFLVPLAHRILIKIGSANKTLKLYVKPIIRWLLWLLVYVGIDMAFMAAFYKTNFESDMKNILYVGYIVIFLFITLRIADSFAEAVVTQIDTKRVKLREELVNVAIKFFRFLIVVIFFIFTLNHFGISITAILSTLGLGGLAVALAAKDTLNNLFGSLSILIDDVFRQGEWVQIGGVEGDVIEIGMRSTTLRTFDNSQITIPNSMIVTEKVRNWNRRRIGRRIKMHIGVTYEANRADLKRGIEDIREMLLNHPEISNSLPSGQLVQDDRRKGSKFVSIQNLEGVKNTQLVYLDKFSDSSIDILIYCFSTTVNWSQWLEVKEDVLFKIMEIFEKNHLEFAYPVTRFISDENVQ